MRSLILSFLIVGYSIAGRAQTPSTAPAAGPCPQLMEQVCGEHCGTTKSYKMGDWSGSATLAGTQIVSTDPDQLVYHYRDPQDATPEGPLKLVTVNIRTHQVRIADMPEDSNYQDQMINNLSGTRYVILEAMGAPVGKRFYVYDRQAEKFTTVAAPAADFSNKDFFARVSPTQIAYFSLASGKFETITFEQTIAAISALGTDRAVRFVDTPNDVLVFNLQKLRTTAGYSPLRVTNLSGERKLIAAHGGSHFYAIQELDPLPPPPAPETSDVAATEVSAPAVTAAVAEAEARPSFFRRMVNKIFPPKLQKIIGRSSTPATPVAPPRSSHVVVYRDGHPGERLLNLPVEMGQTIAASFSDEGHVLQIDISQLNPFKVTTKIYALSTLSVNAELSPRFEKTFSQRPTFLGIGPDEKYALAVYHDSSKYVMESVDLASGDSIYIDQQSKPAAFSWTNPQLTVSQSFQMLKNSRSVYVGSNIINFNDLSVTSTSSFGEAIYDQNTGVLVKKFPLGNESLVVRTMNLQGTSGAAHQDPTSAPVPSMQMLKTVLTEARPGPEKVLPIVSRYFSDGSYKLSAHVTSEAVLWLGAQAPLTLSKYLASYPDISQVISAGDIEVAGDAHLNRVVTLSKRFIDNFASRDYSFPFSILPVLKTYFKTSTQKELMRIQIVEIAEPYVTALDADPVFKRVDSSVRMGLLVQSVRRAVGQKYRSYSDITLDATGTAVAYGTDSIDTEAANPFGVSAKVLGSIDLKNAVNRRFEWQFHGVAQEAIINTRPINVGDLTPRPQESPNYAQLRPNGKLTGVIGISINMGEAFARDLAGQYQEYYEENGFKFKNVKFQDASEGLKFITDRITSGEITYFIREGHGESRAEYALSISPNLEIAKGVNKETNEVVYILEPGVRNTSIPAFNPGFSFSSLGKALRAREHNENEFFYVESKCFGLKQVAQHMINVAAKGFVAVGSDQYATTFTNQPSSGMYVMIDGLRKSKPYSQMYSKGSDTPFYFPNSKFYYQHVGNLANARPTEIEIERHLRVDEGAQ